MTGKMRRRIALLGAVALVAVACSNETTDTTTAEEETATSADATTTTAAPEATETTAPAADMVATDVGVTDEPCPDGSADRGCIYLGLLTDESGPFAASSPGLVAGQRAFWATVNAEGGIGGAYDVALPDDYKKDTQYNPEVFVQSYSDIAGGVAAVAQSLGTPQTIAALPDYTRDNTVAAPMSWWSGWGFESVDNGLVLEFGTNYCFEAMNSLDWAMAAVPAAGRPDVTNVGILFFPTDYGLDYAAGVKIAAEANGVNVAWEAPVIPISAGGDQAQVEAVQQVVANPVDVVFLVTGPSETAAIVGGSAAQGATPIFIGASPTWNVGILSSAAAPAFEAGLYFQSSFTAPWDYDSVGHQKMRDALGDVTPSDFYVSGWMSQYPLKAALQSAYASGDLTHAGIVAAAKSLEDVDFEGMGDNRSYAGAPNDVFPRSSSIGRIDTEASTGVSLVEAFFVGPTAQTFVFDEPCSTVG